MRHIAALVFCAALFLFLPVAAFAAETIGTVAEIEGTATIAHPGGAAAPLALDAPVALNDVLETGKDARLVILLVDDSQFTMGENARLTVDDYVYDPDDNTSSGAKYSVLQGPFIYTSGLIGKTDSHDISIATPFGSLGIRGTTVWGGMMDNEYGVLVQDGEVEVKNQGGSTRLFASQGAMIGAAGKAPRRIGGWSDDMKSRAFATVRLKNAKAAQQRIAAQKQANRRRRVERAKNLHAKRGARHEQIQEHQQDQQRTEDTLRQKQQQRLQRYKNAPDKPAARRTLNR